MKRGGEQIYTGSFLTKEGKSISLTMWKKIPEVITSFDDYFFEFTPQWVNLKAQSEDEFQYNVVGDWVKVFQVDKHNYIVGCDNNPVDDVLSGSINFTIGSYKKTVSLTQDAGLDEDLIVIRGWEQQPSKNYQTVKAEEDYYLLEFAYMDTGIYYNSTKTNHCTVSKVSFGYGTDWVNIRRPMGIGEYLIDLQENKTGKDRFVLIRIVGDEQDNAFTDFMIHQKA